MSFYVRVGWKEGVHIKYSCGARQWGSHGPRVRQIRGKSMKILWHHPEKYSLEVSMRVSQYVSILLYVQAHYFGCISQLPRIVFSGPTINQNSMFNHDHEPKITLNPIYVPIFVGSVLPITWGLKPPTKCPMISFLLLVIFPAIHPMKSYILWIKSS